MDKKVINLLNEQVNKELYSAYLYLDMANYYSAANLNGFNNWFMVQTQEELSHAKLIIQYLQNNNIDVKLASINAPSFTFTDFIQPLEEAYKHEKYVTESIYTIYEAAQEAKDFRTLKFLDWFVDEQAEEEKNVDELINKFKLFASDGKGLYMLDSELATRVYTPPSLVL
jgi:ferritin